MATFQWACARPRIAFDGTNMWVTNYGGHSITKLSLAGVNLGTFDAGGTGSVGIAFDGTNMWVANATSNSVTKLSPSGAIARHLRRRRLPH